MLNTNLTNHFLISMPGMANDPMFGRSLVYLCDHSEQGALGIMINRPLEITLKVLLEHAGQININPNLVNQPVFLGGPVNMDHGYVLHRPVGNWTATLKIGDEMALTSSQDILNDIAQDSFNGQFLVSLGFSGWGAGQLEQELAENTWLSVQALPSIIFDLPVEARFKAAMNHLGIDPGSLAEEAGHG
ncbi:MAG TPA: YqgE/AlgH family protein [Burkholderiales bacterium]|nr:YqgE/AlgH family protein [Burkholderiales bacterium]